MDQEYSFGSKILQLGKIKIDFKKVPLTSYIYGATQPLLMSHDPHDKKASKYLCKAIDELHKRGQRKQA